MSAGVISNLISHRLFKARLMLTVWLAEENRKDVAVAIDGTGDVFYIDSKPIKVSQSSRANRCAMGRYNVDAALDRGDMAPRKGCTIIVASSILSAEYEKLYRCRA